MRTLTYTAPLHMDIQDRPRPVSEPGESEISIAVAGICGSDVSGFLGHSARRTPPLVLGHELVGRTLDGERVVVNPLLSCGHCAACLSGAQNLCSHWKLLGMDQTAGCYAEYVSIANSQIFGIPDHLPDQRAALVEPLANIVHLFRIASPAPFFRMGIVGAGTMGALALLTAKHLGVREILVQDVSEPRLSVARTLGATVAVNGATEDGRSEGRRFAGHGLDLVLDASGSEAARQSAFDLCRPGGLIVLLGMGKQKSEIDFVTSIRKEHRVVMSFAYTPADFERSLSLLISGSVDLTPWTVELPLEEGQKAFDIMTSSPGDTLKMLLRVN
jgi:threonine dehydrogenase-like Zn-dependent dehydrogenase